MVKGILKVMGDLVITIGIMILCIKGWGTSFIKTIISSSLSFFLLLILFLKEEVLLLDITYKIIAFSFLVFFIYKSLRNQGSLCLLKNKKLLISLSFSFLLCALSFIMIYMKGEVKKDDILAIPLFIILFPLFSSIIYYQIMFSLLPLDKYDGNKLMPYLVLSIYTFLLLVLHHEFLPLGMMGSFIYLFLLSFIKYKKKDGKKLYIIHMALCVFYFLIILRERILL